MPGVFIVLAYVLSGLSLGGGLMLFTRLQMPAGFILLLPRSMAVALAPAEALMGLVGMVLGILGGAPVAAVLGGLGAILTAAHTVRVLSIHANFAEAFGAGWEKKIPAGLSAGLLPRRWVGRLPVGPEPCVERDLAFCTIPGTQRALLCDVWQPQDGTRRSGLAFIYFHGSAWYMLDKDFGTRPFFRHLATQGHVVMDVAYRLFPEADLAGMVGDVKRAVAWMKHNADRYGVDPQRIVIGGASAGGHISMLAAYAGDAAGMTPPELAETDLGLRGVVSIYGPTDLKACYYQTHQDKSTRNTSLEVTPVDPSASFNGKGKMAKGMHRLGFDKPGDTGAFVKMLHGHPEQVPEQYARFSPETYVHSGCPPTLLIQGEHDLIVSLKATREMAKKLKGAGVKVATAFYPQADHAFDLMLPRVSPCAQAALFEIDRFIALMASPLA